jgi:hypothetical protein
MCSGQNEQDLDDGKGSMKICFATLAFPLLIAIGLHAQEPAASPAPSPTPLPLDGIFQRPDLWQTTASALQEDFRTLRFRWNSTAQDTARSAAPSLTFGGRRIYEALLRFQGGKLSEATLLYFNRGDAGDLGERDFETLLDGISADLTRLTGRQPVERGRDTTSAVKAEGRTWEVNGIEYLLEWSVTKESRSKGIPFRSEFIRLAIRPKNNAPLAIGATAPTNTSREAVKNFAGREHVEHLPDGTVWLKDVPMVDQGQKGYCVVASAERVLRYYGAEVDQNELAQMANTDASKGTSPDAMFESMKKLTARFGVKTKSLADWDISDFLKMIDDYNRATRRGKLAPEVKLGGQIIDVDQVYRQMKPGIFREIRLKKKSDLGRFQREIQRSIDEGIPLLWSVRLGLVAEKEIPQAAGGHMRLIIGYNTAKQELIYSDSWGRGHEQKHMSIEDAWTITNGLYSLQPIGS